MIFDPLLEGMVLEPLLSLQNLLWFSAIVIPFFIVVGWLTSKSKRWGNIDFPYYLLGAVGVFSLFVSSKEEFSTRALDDNLAAVKLLVMSTIPDDPRINVDILDLVFAT